ncbi:MAG: bifunctional (p)ppGpp synthetase/guanosine-3',5'-bis(diphosphate) 3'-pyrophosphohydrolase [Bacteroidales bacterium]|nr:bifunctional (p)ppGpp synthetase/guanosine-3',5'-bis(diphosphate) 3'-pyrophosphohydrolase [Bacteroidales bacterium]
MSFSKFTQKDYDLINKEYGELKEVAAGRCRTEAEMALVQKAFEFANEAHKNVRRRSGEPYMLHPIAVARIVVEKIGLGCKSICAAILHDVVEDTDYTIDEIRNLFGDKIASLVDGLTKIKTVLDNQNQKENKYANNDTLQAENFKRILLTLNDDVRVVLIKLADRLHNCRTIEFMPEHKRDKVLSETMFIFIPLAHRLGLYEVKSEMENIWLRYKEPEAFREITRRIDESVVDKDKSIDAFIAPISAALTEAGFKFEIKKRIKTPYSVWNKMRTKNVEFEQVYDLYAVRIIFTPPADSKETERNQCYHIFSIITGIYKYQPSRVRDWVKHPKSNGYEALHCTLMSQIGIWIEVQIRSRRMDDIAEKGIAAHWAYKNEGYVGENDSEMDKWLAKVKEILVSSDIGALELLDIIHNDLVSSDIIVFTPKGEQRSIQKGATALDFAYLIHTHIGNKAIAAKVNMKLVPLSYVLHTGDQVEIITAQNARPKLEWLQFLATRHARNIVVECFKDRRDEFTAMGRRIYDNEMASNGIPRTKKNEQRILQSVLLRDMDEFCFRLGLGLIKPGVIQKAIFPTVTPVSSSIKPESYKVKPGDPAGRKFVLASCCNPIPGDPILGFRTPDGVVTIHKKSCPVAGSLASKYGDMVVIPEWDLSGGGQAFPVRISLRGIDKVGLLNSISHYISEVLGVNMRKVYLGSEDGIFEGYIELLVHNKEVLDSIIENLGRIDGIQKIVRTDI